MGSMSYCLFENTSGELARCIRQLEDAESIEDLDFSGYELAAFHGMWRQCRDFLAEHERLITAQNLKDGYTADGYARIEDC